MAKPRFIDDPNVKRWMKQHATSAAAVIPVSMRDYGGFQLLLRDIERLRDYFAPYGLSIHPKRLAGRLWSRYHRGQLTRPPEQTAPATAHISG